MVMSTNLFTYSKYLAERFIFRGLGMAFIFASLILFILRIIILSTYSYTNSRNQLHNF